ncbi:MAG: gamma-glutamyl-gamma-aminobutyrate hydrolase family protein [Hyphomonas sp.]|uniref:gamma-glutamyl-gamma-aminobutyrate hydrolase family protein n=1 Tax=Hyphomonas sp. TaxID=87 RepID=UPI003002746F
MSDSPIVGITKPEDDDNLAYAAIALAVRMAGGTPERLTSGMSWREAAVDALIIGGGSDIFPPHYDQEAIEGAHYDHGRDEMEMFWARTARDSNLPTLAICRGAQVMNVASGGTLHQALEGVYDDVDYPSTLPGHILYRKTIDTEDGSLIRDILGRATTRVNSIHKQAIAKPGKNLVVTARERNGVVQAIEDPRKAFYLGVQFHPEFLTYRGQFRRIFERLVAAAREAQIQPA